MAGSKNAAHGTSGGTGTTTSTLLTNPARKVGDKALCELEKFHCQVFLNGLAERGFSFTVVDHCRTMMKAILEEALDADLIGKNPARKLVNPETKESEKHVLPKPHARRLIESLALRDRLITMIAAFCAMRPGEI